MKIKNVSTLMVAFVSPRKDQFAFWKRYYRKKFIKTQLKCLKEDQE